MTVQPAAVPALRRARKVLSKLFVIVFAVLLGAGGFAAGIYFQASGKPAVDAQPQPAAGVSGVSVPKIELTGAVDADGARRPEFDFVDQFGEERHIADWDGKGLQFVGVALDDSDQVKVFAEDIGMNYPSAHGQQNALDLMRAYGNKTGGLPFTVFVGRDGRIAFRKAGLLTEEELESIIADLLKGA
jgi:hypothetical protein